MNKCPAVIIHAVLAIIVVVAAAFASHSVSASALTDRCNTAATIGHVVMEGRIKGQQFAPAYRAMQEIYDGKLASLGFIVTDAFNAPLYENERSTASMPDQFATYVFYNCALDWSHD